MITLSKLASTERIKIPHIHSFVDTRILYIETKPDIHIQQESWRKTGRKMTSRKGRKKTMGKE